MNLFSPLNEQARQDLEQLLPLIDKLFPIPGRFRTRLPQDVAELSRQLTSERPRRDAGYLGQKPLLSAYLRYFLPWNIFRLARLMPALPLQFTEGDAITDLGSGPLTLPIALWVCRPDLRDMELEFRCLDRTGAILDAGKTILQALPSQWKVRIIRGSLGERIEGKPARLVTAVNLFNELFWDDHNGPRLVAERYAPVLSALADSKRGSLLVVEPGIPRSGEFISHLRAQLMTLSWLPLAPCTHAGACPLPGGKRGAKWCHFAFETDEAPEALHRLSRAAGIPKERATVSFLLAGGGEGVVDRTIGDRVTGLSLRVLSDPFPVGADPVAGFFAGQGRGHGPKTTPSRTGSIGHELGRYACSEMGLLLLKGSAHKIQSLAAGSLLELQRDLLTAQASQDREIDPKSKAPVINLK
ncbi:small ribosomal subunit Rsm22 family protein [Gracilinema caldarium]|uniref:Ribosomal small subunit Rsm22 n=1 Tax=Gracilinema caldarium (strain ATCC 51460 / DSM 7334 / H1) TaxID=744872 RepID=F8EXZ8_GRAC1|nr:small ribosomal subunit Rsm22 family protein [Gracilinema caldarium]AEJ20659.1 Ribosomal small subunit Rsm22 [Gracilinema caldarium DSM 7334]